MCLSVNVSFEELHRLARQKMPSSFLLLFSKRNWGFGRTEFGEWNKYLLTSRSSFPRRSAAEQERSDERATFEALMPLRISDRRSGAERAMADARATTMIEWLLTSISGAPDHTIAPWAAWHGRLMVLSWSFLLPIGMLAARYFKVTPGQDWPRVLDNKLWWRTHLGAKRRRRGDDAGAPHRVRERKRRGRRGGDLSPLRVDGGRYGGVQVAAALLRGHKGGPTEPTLRGDHRHDAAAHRFREGSQEPWMDRRAVCPSRDRSRARARRRAAWMPLVLALWWIALIGVGVALQRAGRCFDTYQAIWVPIPPIPETSANRSAGACRAGRDRRAGEEG